MELTLRELMLMREGRHRMTDRVVREMWEAVRFNTFCLLNIQIDKKHRLKKPSQLIQFPWDGEEGKAIREPSAEEWELINNRFPDTLEEPETKENG